MCVFEKLVVDQLLKLMAAPGRSTGLTIRPGYIASGCRHSPGKFRNTFLKSDHELTF
jgi:hypothetical protein